MWSWLDSKVTLLTLKKQLIMINRWVEIKQFKNTTIVECLSWNVSMRNRPRFSVHIFIFTASRLIFWLSLRVCVVVFCCVLRFAAAGCFLLFQSGSQSVSLDCSCSQLVFFAFCSLWWLWWLWRLWGLWWWWWWGWCSVCTGRVSLQRHYGIHRISTTSPQGVGSASPCRGRTTGASWCPSTTCWSTRSTRCVLFSLHHVPQYHTPRHIIPHNIYHIIHHTPHAICTIPHTYHMTSHDITSHHIASHIKILHNTVYYCVVYRILYCNSYLFVFL